MMSEEIRKHFRLWEFEEEEKWLNTMAARGKGLRDIEKGLYRFEEEEPGEYLYRLFCLKKSASSDRGRYEIALEEEAGWTLVASRGKWAYLRRSVQGGGYDAFADADNKRRILKRWRSLLILLTVILFGVAFYELFTGMVGQHSAAQYIGLALILAGMFLLAVIIRISGTMRWLKNSVNKRKGRF